jgi:starch synthase
MAKSLSILFVTSEVFPFIRVGELGDISHSYTLAMREFGNDVRVMFPKYGVISERKNRIHEINRLRDMPIPVGEKVELATVKSSSINNPRAKVQAYITCNFCYYDQRKAVYDDPKTGSPLSDNDERFIFFSRSVIETCLILGWFPDVIHCNDWQTCLIPAFAKVLFPNKFKKTKFLLSINNFHEQGVFPENSFDKTLLPADVKSKFIHKNKFNFLKGGIEYSDFITTHSPAYLQEILQSTTYSNGLNKTLLEKEGKTLGLNIGIDQWVWMPNHDNDIKQKFESDFFSYKVTNKKDLLSKFGLEYGDEPLIGMISNLTDSSGISVFLEAVPNLFAQDIKIVMLADGENDYKNQLKKVAKDYPTKFSIKFGLENSLLHQIFAGSDIFLIPSKYESNGWKALTSLSYGTVPVARATGANLEFIKDYKTGNDGGNGFLFNDFKADSLIKALGLALQKFKIRTEWEDLALRIMETDTSWGPSLKKYDEIYRTILKD